MQLSPSATVCGVRISAAFEQCLQRLSTREGIKEQRVAVGNGVRISFEMDQCLDGFGMASDDCEKEGRDTATLPIIIAKLADGLVHHGVRIRIRPFWQE